MMFKELTGEKKEAAVITMFFAKKGKTPKNTEVLFFLGGGYFFRGSSLSARVFEN